MKTSGSGSALRADISLHAFALETLIALGTGSALRTGRSRYESHEVLRQIPALASRRLAIDAVIRRSQLVVDKLELIRIYYDTSLHADVELVIVKVPVQAVAGQELEREPTLDAGTLRTVVRVRRREQLVVLQADRYRVTPVVHQGIDELNTRRPGSSGDALQSVRSNVTLGSLRTNLALESLRANLALRPLKTLDSLDTVVALDALGTLDTLSTLSSVRPRDTVCAVCAVRAIRAVRSLESLRTLNTIISGYALDPVSSGSSLETLSATWKSLDTLGTLRTDSIRPLYSLDTLTAIVALRASVTLETLGSRNLCGLEDLLEPACNSRSVEGHLIDFIGEDAGVVIVLTSDDHVEGRLRSIKPLPLETLRPNVALGTVSSSGSLETNVTLETIGSCRALNTLSSFDPLRTIVALRSLRTSYQESLNASGGENLLTNLNTLRAIERHRLLIFREHSRVRVVDVVHDHVQRYLVRHRSCGSLKSLNSIRTVIALEPDVSLWSVCSSVALEALRSICAGSSLETNVTLWSNRTLETLSATWKSLDTLGTLRAGSIRSLKSQLSLVALRTLKSVGSVSSRVALVTLQALGALSTVVSVGSRRSRDASGASRPRDAENRQGPHVVVADGVGQRL